MKATLIALAALVLVGCASRPHQGSLRSAIVSARLVTEITGDQAREIAFHALSHVGVPYHYGGNTPETGFDCSGFVQYVYGRGAGLTLPRNTQAMSEVGTAVSADDLQPGDLLFFDTMRKPYSHVGIYVGAKRFIHAPTSGGTVGLVDLRDRYWQTRFNGARRLSL